MDDTWQSYNIGMTAELTECPAASCPSASDYCIYTSVLAPPPAKQIQRHKAPPLFTTPSVKLRQFATHQSDLEPHLPLSPFLSSCHCLLFILSSNFLRLKNFLRAVFLFCIPPIAQSHTHATMASSLDQLKATGTVSTAPSLQFFTEGLIPGNSGKRLLTMA